MSHAHPENVTGDLLAPDISDLIDQRKMGQVRQVLLDLYDPEIADLLLEISPQHQVVVMRLLPRERAAEVFAHLEQDEQERLVDSLSKEQVIQIFNEMDADDRVDFLEDAPEDLAQSLLASMHPAERAETEKILEYPEESVGREMTPDYLTVRPEWTVAEALEHIRAHGRDAESFNVLYVVDDRGKLIDLIRLRRLLLAKPDLKCEELRQGGQIVSLQATDDRETAVHMMERYDVPVLPVIEADERMVGIVTFDDVADVAEEEVTEDIQKMAGMEALESPYLSARITELVRKRVVWLVVLFGGELLAVSAMGFFEESIQALAILAMFVPLIIASGGNSGSQAASLMIRSLAVGDLELEDWLIVARREMLSGLMMGGILGATGVIIATGVAALLFTGDSGGYHPLHYGMAIGAAIFCVVILGTIVGSMLPFALQRLNIDPATSSTPFVATIMDFTGLVTYFVVANLILHGTVI
ncbi:magnesium transporter [Planctomycetales bacterium ZRK34]|nr:magnesium transporter [Planctomycetales bacterium ZRK34]